MTADGELCIEGAKARDLAARFGSPLFVLSDDTLRQNYRRIRTAFDAEERNRHAVEDYARATCEALRAPLEQAGLPLPALWIEPGRYIAGNAGVLLATVGVIKHDAGHVWVNVDASTNLMPLIGGGAEGTMNHLVAATRMHDPHVLTADVVGPICIPSVLGRDCRLPGLRTGDLVAVLDAGMYAESDSHNLNWMPKPATVMVRGEGEVGLVRAAQTLDAMFAEQRLPEWLRGVDDPPSRFREAASRDEPGQRRR